MPRTKRRPRDRSPQASHSREKDSVTYDVSGQQPPTARIGPKGCEWYCRCPKCDDPVALLIEFKFRDGKWKWLYSCDTEGCLDTLGSRDRLQAITPAGEDWKTLQDHPQPWLKDAWAKYTKWMRQEARRRGYA